MSTAELAPRALTADPDRWSDIRIRIGIHLGTSVRRGDDLFGLDVAMAAQVADQVELKGLRGTHTLCEVLVDQK